MGKLFLGSVIAKQGERQAIILKMTWILHTLSIIWAWRSIYTSKYFIDIAGKYFIDKVQRKCCCCIKHLLCTDVDFEHILYLYWCSFWTFVVFVQMKLLFVDECEKYRDLIHVHSFAHDFHLRCVHHFLRVNSSIFHPGFHLSNFLADFLQIYPVPPTFSRNCLAQGG